MRKSRPDAEIAPDLLLTNHHTMGAMKILLEAQTEAQEDYLGRIVRLVEEEAEKNRQKHEQEAADDCISFPPPSWVSTSKQ